MSIVAEQQLQLNPGFGIEYRGKYHSSEQLQPVLESLCVNLRHMGVEPGMVVASVVPQRWFNALLLLALPRMGCLFFPLDPALPKRLRDQLLLVARAGLVLFDDACLDGLNAHSVESVWSGTPEPEAVHLLLATSGTQGQLRVVELTGQNLISSVLAANARLELGAGDLWLACLPLHHIGGLSIVLRCAQAGATLLLMDRFDAVEVQKALLQYPVTHLSLVPTQLQRLLDVDGDFSPSAVLKIVVLGGAPAAAELVDAALQRGWPVCPSYGLTETASQVATFYPPPSKWPSGCVGLPLEHVEIKVDQDAGDILVRGPSVASRARCLEGSVEKLTDAHGWLRTGDLGRLDETGQLYVIGRGDDVLISGGENIHPQLLEQELLQCPGVEQLAVSAIPDAVWGDALVVLYCGPASADQLRDWARQNLRGAFVPKHFVRTETLPRNAMGKLLRIEVKKQAKDLVYGGDAAM